MSVEPELKKDLRSPSLLSKILSLELQSIPNLPGEKEFEAAKLFGLLTKDMPDPAEKLPDSSM